MAQAFARKGMRLVLADIEPDAVDRAVTALKAHGAEVIGVKTIAAQWTDVNRLAEAAQSAAAGQSLEPTRKRRRDLVAGGGLCAARGCPSAHRRGRNHVRPETLAATTGMPLGCPDREKHNVTSLALHGLPRHATAKAHK